MGTLWGRMGHPKLMTKADPAFPQYRKIIVDQFAKLAQIGADGVHVDKMFPAAIDYNPNLPMSPDTAPWEGAILLTKEVFAACRKYNPDWAMSFECNWDRMLQFSGATWWVGNQRITRRSLPRECRDVADRVGLRLSGRQQRGARRAHGDARADELLPLGRLEAVGRPGQLHQGSETHPGQPDGHRLPGRSARPRRSADAGGPTPVLTTMSSATSHGQTRLHTHQLPHGVEKAGDHGLRGEAERRSPHPYAIPTARVVKLPAEIEIPAERIVFVEEL